MLLKLRPAGVSIFNLNRKSEPMASLAGKLPEL
jgi:hypothetical protein